MYVGPHYPMGEDNVKGNNSWGYAENFLQNQKKGGKKDEKLEGKEEGRCQESFLGNVLSILDNLKTFLSSITEQHSLEWKGECILEDISF